MGAEADRVFKQMCRDILDNGVDTKGEKVRPSWPDSGEKAYTIKRFGLINRYDLSKEFPIIKLRPTNFKKAIDEILWIYQKKSNDLKDLDSKIWDSWAKEDGTIGTCYGYTIGEKFNFRGKETDQMDYVLEQLRDNPFSRRIMTNMYQFKNLETGALDPCAYSMTYNVTTGRGNKLVLNAILNQRSSDVLTANNWNVVQYAVLVHMLAQVNNMEVGELVHVIADAHIYDRHIPMIEDMITRESKPAPKMVINKDIKNFYDFTVEDFSLVGYEPHQQIKNIPVAV